MRSEAKANNTQDTITHESVMSESFSDYCKSQPQRRADRRALRDKIAALFSEGASTMEIASLLKKPEFVIYNLLPGARG